MRIEGLPLPSRAQLPGPRRPRRARWDPTTAGPRKTRPARPLQRHFREKVRPARPLQRHLREKTHPARANTPNVGCFERAGRKTSRTARTNKATLKPTTPLLDPNTGPLKPASPLRPKIAPQTPISHPQRRWRFQSHTGTSEQRRWRFQTTGPSRLQHPHAVPAGDARPRHPRAAAAPPPAKCRA